ALRLGIVLELGQSLVERKRLLLATDRAQGARLAGDCRAIVGVVGDGLVVRRQGVLHLAHVDEHAGRQDVRQRTALAQFGGGVVGGAGPPQLAPTLTLVARLARR